MRRTAHDQRPRLASSSFVGGSGGVEAALRK